ncbi:MAG: hypothetical protein AAGK09_00315 [Planctomycetota bacterium]
MTDSVEAYDAAPGNKRPDGPPPLWLRLACAFMMATIMFFIVFLLALFFLFLPNVHWSFSLLIVFIGSGAGFFFGLFCPYITTELVIDLFGGAIRAFLMSIIRAIGGLIRVFGD